MKRMLLVAAVSVITFICAALFFFPYDTVAARIVSEAVNRSRIPLSYSAVEGGLFSATVRSAVLNTALYEVDMGDLVFRYSPLSVITRKASLDVSNGYGTLKVQHKASRIDISGAANFKRIARLIPDMGDVTGDLNLSGSYDYMSAKGDFSLSAGEFSLSAPLMGGQMQLSGKGLKGSGSITNNIIDISSLITEGDTQVTLKGQIRFDSVNVMRSTINLEGSGTVMGLAINFNASGALSAPKFTLTN